MDFTYLRGQIKPLPEKKLWEISYFLSQNRLFSIPVSQMNPKKFVYNTSYSVQPPYIAGHSL